MTTYSTHPDPNPNKIPLEAPTYRPQEIAPIPDDVDYPSPPEIEEPEEPLSQPFP